MEDKYLHQLEKYFLERAVQNNFDEKSFWGSKESQRKRFSVFKAIGDLRNKSILDYGCGKGDFLQYLSEEGIEVRKFIGIDVVKEFILLCSERFPGHKFYSGDIEDHKMEEQVDYCFASGIFCCFKSPFEMENFALRKIKYMYDIAREGVGVNFLSKFSKAPDSSSVYMNPSLILERVMKEVSSKVVLMHHYMPNDFTIFIYK